MHIKTDIEHSQVQIITLAICPLITAVVDLRSALYFAAGTIICLLVSQLICLAFNKYLSGNVKSMITAIITAALVTIAIIFAKEKYDKVISNNLYFVIFSTSIFNAEFIYFANKASTRHYFLNVLKDILIFVLMIVIFAIIKEFLISGTIYDKQIFSYKGLEFFDYIVFDLIILAMLCCLFDYVVRNIDKNIETKNIVYQKYVKIIRDEKTFQYDRLRRDKLLTNNIEVNQINKADAEKIENKESENEAIESVQKVISEESEVSEPVEEQEKVENPEVNVDAEESDDKTNKKKKKGGKK